MLKSVIFDLDGTLADTIDLIVKSFNYTLRYLTGKDFTRAEIISLFGPVEEVIIDSFANDGNRLQAHELFFEVYQNNHNQLVRTFPGIMEMIQSAHKAGLGIGLVTNKGRRSTEITLERLNLTPYFRSVVTGTEAGRPKPHPSGILQALRDLGVQPDESLFVGDAPVDIIAGKAAGTLTCAVSWGGVHTLDETMAENPHYICRSADELNNLIRNLQTNNG